MSFAVAGFMERPESLDDVDIPGFPTSAKSEGFTANLQGHLEKLSTNAKSIHHVLVALCGGLDRLERKIDATSSQMEARLANIVHHMTGEADEDTMSAWGSLGSAGTPAELMPSPGRRRSFLATQISDGGVSPVKLRGNNDAGGSGESVNDDLTIGEVDIGDHVVPREGGGREQGGAGTAQDNDGDMRASRLQAGLDTADGYMRQGDRAALNDVVNVGDAMIGGDKVVGESSQASHELEATSSNQNGAIPSEGNGAGVSSAVVAASEGPTTVGTPDAVAGESIKRVHQEVMRTPQQGVASSYPRRASNQDDQSDSSNSKPSSARGDGIVFETNNMTDESLHLTNRADQPRALDLQESITSGSSDARHVARLRWIWAFARVCQLIRRRKRKRFEVMSQRATDRTVRMGSRVSVVEKRLDETSESLRTVDRVKDKLLQHSVDIKALNQKVVDLSDLLGVEDRFRDFVQVTKEQIEGMVRCGQIDLETKARNGHEELEARLDGELNRHEDRLDDADDRYEKSESALRLAEGVLGDMRNKMSTVSHDIAEKERQLLAHEERLKSLETLKKTHQRRLSELRMKMENAPARDILLETEPEETDGERMDRLLKAAGTAADFLSVDLGTIVDSTAATAALSSSTGEWEDELPGANKILERLRNISFEAAEFSRFCSTNRVAEGPDGGGGDAIGRAEALCGIIEDTLSAHGHADKCYVAGERQACLDDTASSGVYSLGDIPCPNGRRDLALRLSAARDALHPVIGERTSAGSLKMAILRLRANIGGNLGQVKNDVLFESQWRDLLIRVSELDGYISHIKESMNYRGMGALDDDTEKGAGQGVDRDDLEERLTSKADVSWVQHEFQRLWNALDSRVTAAVSTSTVGCGDQIADSTRPRSAPSLNSRPENPEVACEESQASSPAPSQSTVDPLPFPSTLTAGVVRDTGVGVRTAGGDADHQRRPSFNEGLSLMNNLLRKTSRLEQQMASKADHDEVTRALSSVGIKLRKINIGIPVIEEALSNKIERKDLAKLAALVSSAGLPGGHAGAKNDENTSSPAVLASRLNSKFRCLSCDRPLPALGPPGPPKLGATGSFTAGAGAARSPQRGPRLQSIDAGGNGNSSPRPGSPVTPISAREEPGDVIGWSGGPRIVSSSVDEIAPGSTGPTHGGLGSKENGRRRRVGTGSAGMPTDHPGRLEPVGANGTGEQIAGIMSKYPRMMPPPSRIRTAAGGGIGSRPGSAVGGRF